MFRKWLFRFQEMAGFTEKECQAFLLLALLISLGALARFIPKSSLMFDDAYYEKIDAEFEQLVARADSLDRQEMAPPPEQTNAGRPWAADRPVDLNTATSEELQMLPRIGPAMASRILAFRDRMGRFADVSDLLMIQGIGEKTLALIQDSVFVSAETPEDTSPRDTSAVVRERRADADMLETTDGKAPPDTTGAID